MLLVQSNEKTVREETDSSNDDGGDNPHFFWDYAGDIDSPEKVETPVFPNLTRTKYATWSTGVNLFFPSDYISTPLMQLRPSVQNSLPSPKLNLLESIQESDLLDEVFDFRDNADVLESEVEANIEQSTMDNQVFDGKVKEVNAEMRKVQWKIDMLTP